jgi:hypothetical protein
MKLKFWGEKAPVVEKDPTEQNRIELEGFLEDWGAYATGDIANAADNERRDMLLENIICRAVGVSNEDLKKAYVNCHLTDYETPVLNFEISKRRSEIKSK